MMFIELPWPPSANNLYPTNKRTGRRMLSLEGKFYRDRVFHIVREARRTKNYPGTILGPVRFTMLVHPPNNRRRDMSNLLKIIEDSFTRAGVWEDDSQIEEHHIYKCANDSAGMVRVGVQSK